MGPLAESQIAKNEEHYNDDPNDIENIIHSVAPLLLNLFYESKWPLNVEAANVCLLNCVARDLSHIVAVARSLLNLQRTNRANPTGNCPICVSAYVFVTIG